MLFKEIIAVHTGSLIRNLQKQNAKLLVEGGGLQELNVSTNNEQISDVWDFRFSLQQM
jgi:hypothetical protein